MFDVRKIQFLEGKRLTDYITPSGRQDACQSGYLPSDFHVGEHIRLYFQSGGGNSMHSGQIEMREGIVADPNFHKKRGNVHPNCALQMIVNKIGVNRHESPEPFSVAPKRTAFFYDRICAAYRVERPVNP